LTITKKLNEWLVYVVEEIAILDHMSTLKLQDKPSQPPKPKFQVNLFELKNSRLSVSP